MFLTWFDGLGSKAIMLLHTPTNIVTYPTSSPWWLRWVCHILLLKLVKQWFTTLLYWMCTKATGRSGAKEQLEHSLWLYCYVLSDSAFLFDRHSELEAVDNTSKCCENINDCMLLDFYDLMQPKGSACCDVPALFYEFVFCSGGDGQMASKSSRGSRRTKTAWQVPPPSRW